MSGAKAYFHEGMRVDSLCFRMYRTLVVINKMVDVENESDPLFFIRISDDGVGAEAYSHEETRLIFKSEM